MAIHTRNVEYPAEISNRRREFLKNGAMISVLTTIAGTALLSQCSKEAAEEISPTEDLMREHGLLNRVMLVYDTCSRRLSGKEHFQPEALHGAAQIIRTFIEDYHEKLEEDFLFPRFVNANQLVSLVQLLYIQHAAGKKITDQILELTKANALKSSDDTEKLIGLLHDFNWMYRPHEAWEDTVLFPVLRKIVSKHEYYSLGEDFEKKEHALFGADGFDATVHKVEVIERQLGIGDLSMFTPTLPI